MWITDDAQKMVASHSNVPKQKTMGPWGPDQPDRGLSKYEVSIFPISSQVTMKTRWLGSVLTMKCNVPESFIVVY